MFGCLHRSSCYFGFLSVWFCLICCQMFHFVSLDRGVIIYFWTWQHDVMDGRQRQDEGAVNCLWCRTFRGTHSVNTYFSMKSGKKVRIPAIVLYWSDCSGLLWLVKYFSACVDLVIFGAFYCIFFSSSRISLFQVFVSSYDLNFLLSILFQTSADVVCSLVFLIHACLNLCLKTIAFCS